MPFSRSLGEVFSAHTDTLKDEFRKVLPATVTAVNPVLQTVDVVLGIDNPMFDEQGAVSYEVFAPIANVPLGCLRGGGFIIWLPVAPGDTVLLIFSDLSMDTWRAGNGAASVQPGWVGKHGIDSPIAIPIIVPDALASSAPTLDPTKLIIGKDGSPAQIKISDTDIELGATAADAVALASLVAANLAALSVTVNAAAALLNTPGPVIGATGAVTPFVPVDVASLLVKSG